MKISQSVADQLFAKLFITNHYILKFLRHKDMQSFSIKIVEVGHNRYHAEFGMNLIDLENGSIVEIK